MSDSKGSDLSGFEVYPGTQRHGLCVTIQKGGWLTLNRPAFIALGEPGMVELLFNKVERIIAVRPARDNAHAYKIYLRGKVKDGYSTFTICAKEFVRHCEILTDRSTRWRVTERDGVLFLDLKEHGFDVGRQ